MPSATKRRIQKNSFAYNGTFFVTAGGDWLIVDAGEDGFEELRYEFWFEIAAEDEECDALESVIHLVDAEGVVWEARSHWKPEEIMLQPGSLRRIDRPVAFHEAEAEWRAAFESGALLANCRETLDDRFYRTLYLGDQKYEFQLKYQAALLDLAVVEDEDPDEPGGEVCILARVSGLQYDTGTDLNEVPPFVFEFQYMEGLFTQRYDLDEGSLQETEFVRPVLFKRTELNGQPQGFLRLKRGI